ncbi:hypothetical protein KA013_03375 [Patescibacteria group bacterium]|nr:hypothetical protein [Patescibacteria group bacterium]
MCHKGYKKLAPSFFKEYIIADILNCTQAHKNKNRKISSDFDDKKLGFDLICVDRDSAEIGVVDMTFNKDEINNKLDKLQRFVESKPSKLNNSVTNHDDEYQFDLFDRSEFSYYFFAHSEVRTLKAHTAVLEIHPDKFLCTFMEYMAAINSGKYSHEYIKQKIRTIPGSRKTHRTSS